MTALPRDEPLPGPEPVSTDGTLPGDGVTRWLCAAVHMRGYFADHVAGHLLDPSFTAVYPSVGVDHVTLARHTRLALDRREARDRELRIFALLALAGAVLILLLFLQNVITLMQLPLFEVIWVLAVWLGAFAIVYSHYRLCYASSKYLAVEKDENGAQLDPWLPVSDYPLDPEVERRLRALDYPYANTVTFSGAHPMGGLGTPVSRWRTLVRLKGYNGRTGPLTPFGVEELYRAIETCMDDLGLADPIPVRRMLFVRGTRALNVPGLIGGFEPTGEMAEDGGAVMGPVPTPDVRRMFAQATPATSRPLTPHTQMPPAALDDYLPRAKQEVARTFVTFTRMSWARQLVVTLAVRATLQGDRLMVEGRTSALLPLQAEFEHFKVIPLTAREQTWEVAKAASGIAMPLLFGAWGRWRRARRIVRHGTEKMIEQGKLIADQRDFDHGATTSLRQECSIGALTADFPGIDEVMFSDVMNRRIFEAVDDFLVLHGVDTDEFRSQRLMLLETATVKHMLYRPSDVRTAPTP